MYKLKFLIFPILLILAACSKDKENVSLIKEDTQNLEMIAAYYDAYDSLNKGDPYFAAKKFLEAELLFPQSPWAPKSALMASYSYYLQNYYTEALANLERYLMTYPNSKDLVYTHYLFQALRY